MTVSQIPEAVIGSVSGGKDCDDGEQNPISSIYEFHDELAALLMRCDLHKPDIASVLVSTAVALAAADGCDSELQRTSIEKFAANAIVKLRSFSQSAGIVH